MATPSISVVITAHNEGDELARTVASICRNTRELAEIIVIDDGSQDGSCDRLNSSRDVRFKRHNYRIGVGYSRDEGSREAKGDVICYLDGHQRVGRRCLDRCARVAVEHSSIVSPDLRDYGFFNWRLHGAEFGLCPRQGYFSARWRQCFSMPGIKPVSGLRAPPYLIPRAHYADVAWSQSLRGWGASEASMVVKSFFMGIDILHFAGPLARHRFQKTFPYTTTWNGVWRNQAIIARVCFEDETWNRYWWPRVFQKQLNAETIALLDSLEIVREHTDFLARRKRTDREFWTELLHQAPPAGVG